MPGVFHRRERISDQGQPPHVPDPALKADGSRGSGEPLEPLSPMRAIEGPPPPDGRPETRDQGPETGGPRSEIPGIFRLNEDRFPVGTGDLPSAGPALPPEAFHRIIAAVRWSFKTGGTVVRLELRPASLGRVNVQVVLEGGLVSARIQVEVSSTKAALEANLPSLEQTLHRQGIPVGRFDITVGSDVSSGGGSGEWPSRPEPWGGVQEDRGPETGGQRRAEGAGGKGHLQAPVSGLRSLVDITV